MNVSVPSNLVIPDLRTGNELLARLPLADPTQAAADLNTIFLALQTAPPDLETYFLLLEHARLPLAQVTDELARRYVSKPLPFSEFEDTPFQTVVGLWQRIIRGYAQCGELTPPAAESTANQDHRVATLLHRCLWYTGQLIFEHQRAHREYPWGLWLELHGYYASAEEWALATHPVLDPQDARQTTHCLAAYLAPLLCDMAGCFNQSPREQALTRRWALAWSPLVMLQPVVPGEGTPAFVIDLMHDTALRPAAECLQTEHLRRLDTSRLALQISDLRRHLRHKSPAEHVPLCEGYTPFQCNRLLEALARPWTQARAPRKYRRHATTGISEICTGFEEMHYYVAGKEFEQPENIRNYSRREFETMFVFRFQDDPQQTLQTRQVQLGYALDPWEVVNQSANGFRLLRSVSGKRMAHGQLLALRPHDGHRFLLAKTTWLMQEKGGGLIAGIQMLPGCPTAIAARRQDAPPESHGRYERAFLLPALPGIAETVSIIVHPGWFRPGRIIEIYGDGPAQIRLTQLLDSGPDYELAAFAPDGTASSVSA